LLGAALVRPPPPLLAPQIWVDCGKIVQELLKNQQTKIYFGEPVKESYVPNYYSVIKNPMDLGTIKSALPCFPALFLGLAAATGCIREAFCASGCLCLAAHQGKQRPRQQRAATRGAAEGMFAGLDAALMPARCLTGRAAGKVEQRRYNNVYEFRDDVRLTFNNCRIFNPPGE
jgi:hypothetical protein